MRINELIKMKNDLDTLEMIARERPLERARTKDAIRDLIESLDLAGYGVTAIEMEAGDVKYALSPHGISIEENGSVITSGKIYNQVDHNAITTLCVWDLRNRGHFTFCSAGCRERWMIDVVHGRVAGGSGPRISTDFIEMVFMAAEGCHVCNQCGTCV